MARSAGGFAVPRPGWRGIVAAVLAVVVIGVLIVARLSGGGVRPGAAPQPSSVGAGVGPAASASASASASALPDDGVHGPDDNPYTRTPPAAALRVARLFVTAWADHPAGISAAKWWAGVSRHSDSVLRKQLEATDPQRVPATKVTGPARGLSGGVTSATVAVPTDAGEVVLTCIQLDGRWFVSDIDITRAEQ